MTIIEIKCVNGVHDVQSQNHRESVWLEGYIEVPEELASVAWDCCGRCDLAIEDGVLVGIVPLPEPERDLAVVVAELKQRLTDTDYQIIKCSEYQLSGMAPPYDIAALHAERQAIRDEINRLEADHETESGRE